MSDVQQSLEAVTGLGTAWQSLSLDGTTLSAGSTLGGAGVSSGSTVVLTSAETSLALTVALPSSLQSSFGPSIKMAVSSTATVSGLLNIATSVLPSLQPPFLPGTPIV